ncbi:hypothetical protein TRVA0_048S01002 [Trichomonascus vanleenenianus]|uniref:uncharacterized protein n=1 Tax=Trichomonascus vanleenenianus TaxID=2268995 RepID=UPI003EC9E614
MPKSFMRKQEYHRKYQELNTRFDKNRQALYEQQKAALQKQLQDVIDEKDDELLDRIKDLEEARDNDLLRLNTWQSILLSRTQLQHDKDMEQIDREYDHVSGVVETKMMQRLESHVKRFKEDKSLVDVSSDASLELTAGLAGSNDTTAAFFAKSGGGQGSANNSRRQVKLRRRDNTRGGSGSESGIASEALSGRRTGAAEKDLNAFLSDVDLNAYSSSEAISASAAAAAESAAANAPSRITNARNTKATKALTSLKTDEINQDLALLRRKR